MKITAFLVSTLIGTAVASPAIVWKKTQADSPVVHSSDRVNTKDILADAVDGSDGSSSLATAVFVLGRAADGTETLSGAAGSGNLPGVASKYDSASCFHSHVSGVRGGHSFASDAEKSGRSSAEISIAEFASTLTAVGAQSPFDSKEVDVDETGMYTAAEKEYNVRARALTAANVVVVNVPDDADKTLLDSMVVKAIEHNQIHSVILTAQRSTNEIKEERVMEARRRMKMQEEAGRHMGYSASSTHRRLDQVADDDVVAAANNLVGVYYVNMTPNILAGLLFGLFFAVITWTGLNCMGMIAGQDVYVNKMPLVGREA